MIGKEFKVPEENVKDLNITYMRIDGHKAAMNHHSSQLSKNEAALWATVRELMPDIDFDTYDYTYDVKTGVIHCISRLEWRED